MKKKAVVSAQGKGGRAILQGHDAMLKKLAKFSLAL